MADELLPPGIEPMEADVALEREGDFLGSDPIEVETGPPPPLGRTPAYDFVGRTFLPSRAGGVLMLTGLGTLEQWIEKCIRTRRGENPACDPDFGVEVLPIDLLDGGVLDESAIAEAYGDWTRALETHPRISDVADWSIDYAPGDDAVFIGFRYSAEGTGGELEDVTANLQIQTGGA